jgi:N-acetylmuramoyl-L-alanine amidase
MRWNRYVGRNTFYVLVLFGALSLGLGQNNSGQIPPSQTVTPAAPMQPAAPAQTLVMIDAAHGGSESGALLNPAIPEKDVTLTFARRLRQELAARGVSSALIRDSDATLTTDQRAAIVNSARPALYICIHASSLGNGMQIFAAMIAAGGNNRGPFVNWQSAQAPAGTRSLWVQRQITAATRNTGFPVRSLPAPLLPLNNVVVPAVAVEIAPTTGNISQLASTDYQQMVCAALANAIAGIAPSLRPKAVDP